MNYSNKPSSLRDRGFTIVELLVVVVVIGILASITVVGYNGITQRAQYLQQVSEVDKIGKAIQLWTAQNGKSIGESGSGYDGRGLGGFYSNTGSYPSTSLHALLVNSGYLSNLTYDSSYMLTPCTTETELRWVVMVRLTPAPSTTVAAQKAESGCTSTYIDLYSNATYQRNFMKAF